MIIEDSENLVKTERHKSVLKIIQSGLDAANPENFLPKFVKPNKIILKDKSYNLEQYGNIYTVAFGKAADSMTRTINSLIKIKTGIVVIPKGSKSTIKGKKFHIFIRF